jgi:hypothetical protein
MRRGLFNDSGRPTFRRFRKNRIETVSGHATAPSNPYINLQQMHFKGTHKNIAAPVLLYATQRVLSRKMPIVRPNRFVTVSNLSRG